MLFVNMGPSVPRIRIVHYFVIHAGFVLGVLYFFFTKKISRYTFRDLLWSAFTLFSMAALTLLMCGLGMEDCYFLLSPPEDLMWIKESVGQAAYTFGYALLIAAVMAVNGAILHFATRKRDGTETFGFRKNSFLQRLSVFSPKTRIVSFSLMTAVFAFVTVVQNITLSAFLFWVDFVLILAILVCWALNEVSLNYREWLETENIPAENAAVPC